MGRYGEWREKRESPGTRLSLCSCGLPVQRTGFTGRRDGDYPPVPLHLGGRWGYRNGPVTGSQPVPFTITVIGKQEQEWRI